MIAADDSKRQYQPLTDSADSMYEGDKLSPPASTDGSTQLFSSALNSRPTELNWRTEWPNVFIQFLLALCPECEGFGKVIGIDEHLGDSKPCSECIWRSCPFVGVVKDGGMGYRNSFMKLLPTISHLRPLLWTDTGTKDYLWYGPRNRPV